MKRAKELKSPATWLILYKEINPLDAPSKTFVYHQKIHNTHTKLQNISSTQKIISSRLYSERSKTELYEKLEGDWVVMNVEKNEPLELKTYSVVTIENKSSLKLESHLLTSEGHCEYQSIPCSFYNKTTLSWEESCESTLI